MIVIQQWACLWHWLGILLYYSWMGCKASFCFSVETEQRKRSSQRSFSKGKVRQSGIESKCCGLTFSSVKKSLQCRFWYFTAQVFCFCWCLCLILLSHTGHFLTLKFMRYHSIALFSPRNSNNNSKLLKEMLNCGWEVNLRNDPHTWWTISAIVSCAPEKFSGVFGGIQTHDLCNADAVLSPTERWSHSDVRRSICGWEINNWRNDPHTCWAISAIVS